MQLNTVFNTSADFLETNEKIIIDRLFLFDN